MSFGQGSKLLCPLRNSIYRNINSKKAKDDYACQPAADAAFNSGEVSFIVELECSGCGEKYSHDEIHTFCPVCQSPLLVRYDLEAVRKHIDRDDVRWRQGRMWRWHELLPVKDPGNFVFLGEGDTPLLHLPSLGKELGYPYLFVKDESSNPTGSFKARGLAAAVSKAKELGIKKVIIPTAGNAGGAMAAYAARAWNSGSHLYAKRYSTL